MKALLLLAVVFSCHAVHAQAVYRCGPDGRSYSQTPCAEGRSVDVSDDRTSQQRREALDVADRDRGLADSLQQDRLTREAQPRAGAALIDGRIGSARLAHAEPVKSTLKKKRSTTKAPRHADRSKANPGARS